MDGQRQRLGAIALATAITAAAAPAGATIVLITYTGTVSSGYDSLGFFGTPYSNLNGDAFTVTYRVNDATPGAVVQDDLPSYTGLGGYYSASPVSAVVTIAGHRFAIAGDFVGAVQQAGPADPSGTSLFETSGDFMNGTVSGEPTGQDAVEFVIGPSTDVITASPDYETPLSYAIQPQDIGDAEFIYEPGCVEYGYCDYFYDDIQFAPTEVTVSDLTGVPEPGTWLLMVVGGGVLGAGLRRRPTPAAA
jgi:hypothetical protein